MKVARLVADMESLHSELADFLFSARFDCTQDEATVKYVSKRFNTHTFINKSRRAEVWPFSCNELAIGSLDHIYTQGQAGKFPEYKAILLFEADSCPLVPSWIPRLHSEWGRLNSRGANMIGAMTPPGPPETEGMHINGGSCLISGAAEHLHWIARKVGGCKPSAGWDWYLTPQFKQHGWADCPGMKSFWRAPTMEQPFFDRICKEGVFFVHGIKNDSVIRMVREKYLPGTHP